MSSCRETIEAFRISRFSSLRKNCSFDLIYGGRAEIGFRLDLLFDKRSGPGLLFSEKFPMPPVVAPRG